MNLEKGSSVSIIVRVSVFATLVILGIFMTLWTSAAHDLARWGWSARGSLSNATFLPFPTGPRGVLMDVLAKMSSVDEFIYLHLLKTGMLNAICVSLWALAVIYAFTVFLPLLKNPKLAHTN